MADLLSGFPMYGPIVSGPFHVSLSMPSIPSDISKSIGATSSASILIPNLDYLIKFVNGDIGIADTLKKSMMLKNINMAKTEDAFKQFAKLIKLDIQDPSKYKTKNGYSVPMSLISVDPSDDMMGIKAMEKTILKSMFETQKPYIEIAQLIIGNIAKIEDIIARFMPIITLTDVAGKLAVKSEKPKTNSGVGGPKALGYNNAIDLKSGIGKLSSLSKKGKEVSINKDGVPTTNPDRVNPTDGATAGQPESNSTDALNGDFRVISTVYSTGEFDPTIQYKYTYVDLKDDSFGSNDLPDASDLSLEDDDPYAKLKPEKVIFGIFNSKGDIINPFTRLKALDGTVDSFGKANQVDTTFYVADWITKSAKWYFPNKIDNQSGQYSWNRFGAPFYYWERYGGSEVQRSQNIPDPGTGPVFTKKKYDNGNNKGQEIVDFTGTVETQDFVSYFTDLVSKKINASIGLEPEEKVDYIDQVISKLYEKTEDGTMQVGPYTLNKTQIDNHLDNAFKYGVLNGSTFVNPNNQQPMTIPNGMKYPLKPGRFTISGKDVFMDPESDYDLKIIKVDSVLDIRYEDSQGDPEISTQILSFIKNSLSIVVDNNGVTLPFSISISKNQESAQVFENITDYQLDNWNYDDVDGLLGSVAPVINNNNTYIIEVWRYDENPYFVGKSNITFPLQNNSFVEMDRLVGNQSTQWSYREYTVTSNTNTIQVGSSDTEFDVEGMPTNGDVVTKVKAKLVNQVSIVTSWYYKKSGGVAGWYTQPPTSWKSVGFHIDWQTVDAPSYNDNGSLPQTKVVNSKKFNISISPGVSSGTSSTTTYWKFSDILSSVETRTYQQVSNGEKTLGEKSLVEVSDYKIKRWIVWKDTVGLGISINSKPVMPGFRKNNNISLLYNTFGNNATFDIISNVSDIPAFQVRVKDGSKYGKMIDPSKVTNSHLTGPDLYSPGKYGGSPQEIGLVNRYMRTELDTETYYILEGILVDSNVQNSVGGGNQNNTNTSGQVGGHEYYRMPNALGATKVFLSMLADIFSKLIPSIKKLLALFKNPAGFITDIISEKMGENFLIFSKEAMSTMTRMPNISIPNREQFIKNSVLSNYISVNPDGSYRFLLDGSGLMKLPILGNTITFGMQLAMLKPLIKLIFSVDFNNIPNNTLGSFLNETSTSKSPIGGLGNVDLRSDQNDVKNTIVTESNGVKSTEEVSIQYSTGKFIEGVDYQYIYLTDYVASLVKEAEDLEQTGDPDNLELAKAKLELALKSDPKNALLQNKFDDLFKKTNNYIQPILKFLIEIVSLPIKIVAGIIQWVMDFFKSLSLPSLPSKMKDFLSFKWILDFFSPVGLLALAGIKFDIPKLIGWVSNLKNFPADYEFDLSEVIDIALIAKMPKVKKDQFLDMLKKPFRILYSMLCLLESLINGIIDFIWSLLGIEAIIPPPHIKLCQQLNEPGNMSVENIMDLLNGMLKDPGASSMSGGTGTAGQSGGTGDGDYNFIYEIKLPDGRLVRDLNQDELRKFVDDNKDLNFDFLFS